MEEFRAWQKATNGLLNKIALAPEREGVEDCSDHYRRRVTVALGHSNATFEKLKAVDAGAVSGCMPTMVCIGLTHRELGMVGAM